MGKIYRKEFCDPDSIDDFQTAMTVLGGSMKGEHVVAIDENRKVIATEEFVSSNGRISLNLNNYEDSKTVTIARQVNGWWTRDASAFPKCAEEMQVRQV